MFRRASQLGNGMARCVLQQFLTFHNKLQQAVWCTLYASWLLASTMVYTRNNKCVWRFRCQFLPTPSYEMYCKPAIRFSFYNNQQHTLFYIFTGYHAQVLISSSVYPTYFNQRLSLLQLYIYVTLKKQRLSAGSVCSCLILFVFMYAWCCV